MAVGTENYTFHSYLNCQTQKIIIGNTERKTIVRETFNISDAYNQYDGKLILYNNKAANGDNAVHPDHHSLHALNINRLIKHLTF